MNNDNDTAMSDVIYYARLFIVQIRNTNLYNGLYLLLSERLIMFVE